MSRQINLYDPAFRKQRDWLSSQSLVTACLLVILLVTVGAGLARWTLATRMQEASAVNGQLQSVRSSFTEVTRAMSSMKSDPVLAAEVEDVQNALKSAQSALGLLQGMAGQAAQPAVAGMMQALSRSAVDGLWLTGLALSEGSMQLEIRGRMTDQALLPAYLRRLESEPVFQGRRFDSLAMKGGEWIPPVLPGAAVDPGKSGERKAERWFVEFALRTGDAPKSEGGVR